MVSSPARVAFLIFVVFAAAPAPTQVKTTSLPEMDDEFVGPFASWTVLTTRYPATGNGITDDTASMQRALDELGEEGRSPVLFIPAGTYRITRTLVLDFTINVSVVGEDPAATTLVWGGEPGGTMMRINGVAYRVLLA